MIKGKLRVIWIIGISFYLMGFLGCATTMGDMSMAIHSGDIDLVEDYLINGFDHQARNDDGQTPLMLAAIYGKKDIVNKFVNLPGIDINAKDHSGISALLYASFQGYSEITRILIENGADINVSVSGVTPLLAAIKGKSIDTVKVLVGNGADINKKDNDGNSSLVYASYVGSLEIAKLLVEEGVEVTAYEAAQALVHSMDSGSSEILMYISAQLPEDTMKEN